MSRASRQVYYAPLGAEGVSASTGYLLVDLSGTSTFKHTPSLAFSELRIRPSR